ncbi:MAG: methyltransferase [Bacteroidota bacterium]|nr:methyltransferase [Bacteroidota bacterium]
MFHFKKFNIKQDKAAMKVGTDGVLLGAWINIPDVCQSALDIGTGTGLIALMLAQRSDIEIIDGIEIEDNAYEQTVENFENTPWNDRLFCYHCSLEEFSQEIDDKYDLIVCNPPFFDPSTPIGNNARAQARYTTSLPFSELLKSVDCLLSETGTFGVIIPFEQETHFINLALENNLFPSRITRVRGNAQAPLKRSLLTFVRTKENICIDELVIETARHTYTSEYIELVKDFYLNM